MLALASVSVPASASVSVHDQQQHLNAKQLSDQINIAQPVYETFASSDNKFEDLIRLCY